MSVAAPTIEASLDGRFVSGLKDERVKAAKFYEQFNVKAPSQLVSICLIFVCSTFYHNETQTSRHLAVACETFHTKNSVVLSSLHSTHYVIEISLLVNMLHWLATFSFLDL